MARYLSLILLLLMPLLAFWKIGQANFIYYDDWPYVLENQYIHGGLTSQSIFWAFTTFFSANWHPLTWLSYMADIERFGVDPAAFHLTNLTFHIANGLLLFFILFRTTGFLWRSFFVAALFAIHPLHVESVAWISERKDVLSTFFMFLTIGIYTTYAKEKRWWQMSLVVLFFIFGLMSKPMLVSLPILLLLLDYWPLERFKKGESLSELIIEKIPLFILSAIACGVTLIAQREGGAMANFETFPLVSRISNALMAYSAYIRKMFWPADLAIFYPVYPVPLWHSGAASLLLIAVSIFVIYFLRKYPYLVVGWLWYLVTLLPVIGLVQVGLQAMADRYTYIPLIGLFIMTIWGLSDLAAEKRVHKIVLGSMATVVILALTFISYRQVSYWRNSVTLFQHVVSVTKDNYIMHYNLGVFLAAHGKYDEAVDQYLKVLKIQPEAGSRRINNLGSNQAKRGEFDKAITCFKALLKFNPNFAPAHFNLALILEKTGKPEEAIQHYQEVLRIVPNHEATLQNLKELTTQSNGQ